LSQVAAEFVKIVPYISGRPVSVVGGRFNYYGYSARTVAFIGYFFKIASFALTGSFFYASCYIVIRQVCCFAFSNNILQSGIGIGICTSRFYSNCQPSLVNILPLWASDFPFLPLILAHFECPDILPTSSIHQLYPANISEQRKYIYFVGVFV
jgi:hypothetical protein